MHEVTFEAVPGKAGHHRPLTVEITADTLILRWLHDAPWHIPLERINWVSEEGDPEAFSYRPSFVTLHYDDPWGRPATLTLASWEPAHALVAAIVRAREARMARLNWSFSGR